MKETAHCPTVLRTPDMRYLRILITLFIATACFYRQAMAADSGPDKPASAEARKEDQKKEEAKLQPTVPDASRKPVTVTNSVLVAGQRVTYTVETGMLPLLKADGAPRASVFYMAYTRLGETNTATRPVTFCFNGGPGSSSVWLHLGGLGPRRVKLNDDGTMPPPPFGLVDNEYSILHATDLVFIDPVATGYSRPSKDEKAEQFFGQSGDVESVGDFIRLWTTRGQRWRSPKYLCGESYGVFRAAGLAEHLHSRYGMYLNGLILVSGLLDYGTIREARDNDLPSISFLPSFTATAQFHKKLPTDLQSDLPKAIGESRAFARGPYAAALLAGASLPKDERARIVAQLARLTGLTPQVIEDHELRVSTTSFRELLLRDQGLILGRFDSRITGRDADKTSNSPRFDPSYAVTYGPFSAAMNAYLREELKFENDLPYEILSGVGPWNFASPNSYPSSSGQLASAMSQNPYLRVLVLGAWCDLACPVDGIRHSIDHLTLDTALRKNIAYVEYESGHMMYVNLADLKKLQKDLESFLKP